MRISRPVFAALLIVGSLLCACQAASQDQPGTPESVLPTPGTEAFRSPVELATESPDAYFEGSIAFHSERSGSLQLYILDGETGETEPLTFAPAGSFEPNWSPDCKSLAFASEPDPGSFEIYTMQIGSDVQKRLFENQPADDWSPAWSPEGDVIAYQTNQTGKLNVCFVSVDGEQQGCIEGEHSNALPAWSPDGSSILFISNRDGDWEIYLDDFPTTSSPTKLTDNEAVDMHPRFSPDGELIVFDSKRSGNYDIFVMKADGSQETQLTSEGADDVMPDWLGDGRIVFASRRTSDWELYLMDQDGQNVTRLTSAPGLDKWPVWCHGR